MFGFWFVPLSWLIRVWHMSQLLLLSATALLPSHSVQCARWLTGEGDYCNVMILTLPPPAPPGLVSVGSLPGTGWVLTFSCQHFYFIRIYHTVNRLRSFLSSSHLGQLGHLSHFGHFVSFLSFGSFRSFESFRSFGSLGSFWSFGQHWHFHHYF